MGWLLDKQVINEGYDFLDWVMIAIIDCKRLDQITHRIFLQQLTDSIDTKNQIMKSH